MKKKLNAEMAVRVLLVLTIAAIWGQSMIHKEASQVESDALLTVLNPFDDVEIGNATSEAYWHLSDVFRKLAHLIEYGILGCELMVFQTIRKQKVAVKQAFINLLFAGMLIGLIDETIQVFSQRGSLVSDVWIDTLGLLLGLVFSRMILRKVQKSNKGR